MRTEKRANEECNLQLAGQRQPGDAEPARRDAVGHAAGSGRRGWRGRRRRVGGRARLGEGARARGRQGPPQLFAPALLRQGEASSAALASRDLAARPTRQARLLQKLRWWCAVGIPFVAFYLTGLALELTAPWYAKVALLVALGAALHALTAALLDDDLKNIFPLSVYLATKVGRRRASISNLLGRETGTAPLVAGVVLHHVVRVRRGRGGPRRDAAVLAVLCRAVVLLSAVVALGPRRDLG